MNFSFSKFTKITKKITQAKRVIGIDIDDRSIEIALLEKAEGKPRIISLGRIVMDFGVVENGIIKNEKKLSKLLIKVFNRAQPQSLNLKSEKLKGTSFIFSLSVSKVYTQIFDFNINSSELSKNEFEQTLLSGIDQKVKSYIPLEPSNLLYSYKILRKSDSKTKVLIVATDKKNTRDWFRFFKKNNIIIDFFDVEALALFRGLLVKEQKLPVCVVDIGASNTLISVFDKTGLYYSYSLDIAGDNLTEELVRKMKVRYNQGENLKEKYGLADPSKKVFPILIKVLEPVVKEIGVAIDFYKKNAKKDIKGVIMVGGTSKLRGLSDYLSTNLDVKIWSGNSVLVKQKTPLEFIEAIGLALGGLSKKYSDLLIKFKEEESKVKIDLKNFNFKKDFKKIIISLIKRMKSFVKNEQKTKKIINKFVFNQKILVIVFIVSLIFLSAAFFYREQDRSKRAMQIKTKVTQFAQTQVLNIDVPIALNISEYKEDRVSARLVNDVVEIAKGYSDALEISSQAVQNSIKEGEVIWGQPINAINKNNIIFPLRINWLIYNQEEADELVVKEIDKLNTKESDYILNKIERMSISYTDNPNVMMFANRVVISSHEPFEIVNNLDIKKELIENTAIQLEGGGENKITKEQFEQEVETNNEEVKEEVLEEEALNKGEDMVLILETEIGWLNVRSGQGVSFDLIGRVSPGESYPLLEEQEKWYKIKVSDRLSGWISSAYTEIIK